MNCSRARSAAKRARGHRVAPFVIAADSTTAAARIAVVACAGVARMAATVVAVRAPRVVAGTVTALLHTRGVRALPGRSCVLTFVRFPCVRAANAESRESNRLAVAKSGSTLPFETACVQLEFHKHTTTWIRIWTVYNEKKMQYKIGRFDVKNKKGEQFCWTLFSALLRDARSLTCTNSTKTMGNTSWKNASIAVDEPGAGAGGAYACE